MASMYPKTLENYNPTVSEQRVFEALKTQLDDTVSVFYSISWISSEVAERSMSEIDFLIIDPEYGYPDHQLSV